MIQKVIWPTAVGLVLLFVSFFTPTYIYPPKNLIEPRGVFVIDHGTHSSLAIENSRQQLIRYAYGDFRYYALRDTGLSSGAAALLFPTPATLGRAEIKGGASLENLSEQLVVAVEVIYQLEVEASAADQLISKLDSIHLIEREKHVDVPAYGLVFAPHPDDYFWAHNSSTIVADWLRDMRVELLGWGLIASWGLAE